MVSVELPWNVDVYGLPGLAKAYWVVVGFWSLWNTITVSLPDPWRVVVYADSSGGAVIVPETVGFLKFEVQS